MENGLTGDGNVILTRAPGSAMSEAPPRYLVIAVGTAGDIYPFMRIATALQSLGRQSVFITNSYHAPLVRDAGLPFVGLGTDEEYLRIVASPDLWHPRKGFAALMANYGELLGQMNDAIRGTCGPGRNVVIAHPFAVPGACISRELGVLDHIVGAYLAPSNFKSCYDPLQIGPTRIPRWVPMGWRRAFWRFVEKGWIDPVAAAQVNAVRKPSGLPPIQSLLAHIADAPDLSVTLFPSWFAPAAPDWPHPLIAGDFQLFDTPTQDSLAPDLSAFLAAGESPLVFTPGTGNLHARRFFACALAAIERLGRRAIFLTRERSQVPENLPESVLWRPYVPLSALLPHAAALIHHGGIGSSAEALRAGIPQLITPFAWDQFDNGARIAALGAGEVIPARRLRPRRLARSLQALTGSGVIRARCAELASRLIPPHDPTALCNEIERHLITLQDDSSRPPACHRTGVHQVRMGRA